MHRAQMLRGLTMLILTSACTDMGAPEEGRLGRFRLHRINGDPLPAFVTEGSAARIDFLSGAVHLNADATFVDSTELKVTPKGGGSVRFDVDVAMGTYRVSNDTVFFSSTRGERYLMVYLSEQSLRQDLGGSVLIYIR